MQRWIKLPNGSFLDANRICHIGKVDTFPKLDGEGNSDGIEYAVALATELPREHQLTVTGSKEEISALLKSLLGNDSA